MSNACHTTSQDDLNKQTTQHPLHQLYDDTAAFSPEGEETAKPLFLLRPILGLIPCDGKVGDVINLIIHYFRLICSGLRPEVHC